MSVRFRLTPVVEFLRASLAVTLAATLAPLPIVAQTTPVVVAPGSGHTRVYTTPGGVTVVDIDTANAAGLSHNRYTHYNVPSAGLVLNNGAPTQFTHPSQLAGGITANFNIGNPASVILNEVVAPNASTLAGVTEVVGTAADVVVANPYGIAIQGAAFINTNRVTLATASPVIGSDGALATLQIADGRITIGGDGINTSNLDYLRLLGRAVQVDGQLNASDLLVGAGPGSYDYAADTFTAANPASSTVEYAIDSSLLGGMYANRIRLIATDAGVGVRLLGDAAATAGDFTINAAGRVELTAQAYAAGSFGATGAGGVSLSGSKAGITADADVTLAGGAGGVTLTDAAVVAGRDLRITGRQIVDTSAQRPASANRFAVGTVHLNAEEALRVDGSAYGAGADLIAEGASVQFGSGATLYSGADAAAAARGLHVTARSGDIDTGDAQILSAAELTLAARNGAVRVGDNRSGEGVQAGTHLRVDAGSAFSSAGNVSAAGDVTVRFYTAGAEMAIDASGSLIAGGAVSIADADEGATALFRQAGSFGGRSIDVRVGELNNSGVMQASNRASIDVAGAFNNAADAAVITAGTPGAHLNLTAGSLRNDGFFQSSGGLTFDVDGTLENTHVIFTQKVADGGADGAVTLHANSLTNAGIIQSAGGFQLAVDGASKIAVNNSGELSAASDLSLATARGLANASGGKILAGGNLVVSSGNGAAWSLDNRGVLQAGDAFTLGSDAERVAVSNANAGILFAGGALEMTGSSLTNAGTVRGGSAVNGTFSHTITNSGSGLIRTAGAAGSDVALAANRIVNGGEIASVGNLTFGATDVINNSGRVLVLGEEEGGTAGRLDITADGILNSGSILALGDADIVSRNAFENLAKSSLEVHGDLSLTTGKRFSNASGAQVLSGGDILIGSDAVTFVIDNDGRIQADGALDLGSTSARSVLTNGGSGTILAGGELTVRSTTIDNGGLLRGTTAADFRATRNIFNRMSGVLATAEHAGARLIVNAESFLNQGFTQSTGDLSVDVDTSFSNTGTLVSLTDLAGGDNGDVDIDAGTFFNRGTIRAADDLDVVASDASTTSFVNLGEIGSEGHLTITAANRQENSAYGTIVAGGRLTMRSGDGDYTFLNEGLVQSWSKLVLGATGERVALENSGSRARIVAGGSIDATTSTTLNSGAIEAGDGLVISATGSITNTGAGTVLNSGSSAGATLQADSLANDGQLQSSGWLSAETQGQSPTAARSRPFPTASCLPVPCTFTAVH